MGASEDELKIARSKALQVVSLMDARINEKLLKRARKHGMTDRDEIIGLLEVWKDAARRDKHRKRSKGH